MANNLIFMKSRSLRNYLVSGAFGLMGIVSCGNESGFNSNANSNDNSSYFNSNENQNYNSSDCLPQNTENFYYETREECEANGGEWGRWGLLPLERCNMRTSDYGNLCNGWGDCEGICIADGNGGGYCSEHVTEFGCYTEIVGCGEEREICRD